MSLVELSELKRLRFKPSGTIKSGGGNFPIEFIPRVGFQSAEIPGVYIWLSRKTETTGDVVYVGKAGNGIVTRMLQHRGGLRKNPSRVERIQNAIKKAENTCLEVWFRTSPEEKTEVTDAKVSFYSVEEEALITRFAPELNRANPPALRMMSSKDYLEEICIELESSSSEQGSLWRNAVSSMNNATLRSLRNALRILCESNYMADKKYNLKVIGGYASGPIRHKPLLAFGKIAKKLMTHKILWISLDGEFIAFPKDVAIADACSEKDGSFKISYFVANPEKFHLHSR